VAVSMPEARCHPGCRAPPNRPRAAARESHPRRRSRARACARCARRAGSPPLLGSL